jgi:hypothetical protein
MMMCSKSEKLAKTDCSTIAGQSGVDSTTPCPG